MNHAPSYLGAFLRHPFNRTALLAAAAAGVFASIPLGWAGLGLVATLTLGVEVLAALTVPSLPPFRAWVDRQAHQQALARRRDTLLQELRERRQDETLNIHRHLVERVQVLRRTMDEGGTTLTPADLDKLEALTVDHLALAAAHATLRPPRAVSQEAQEAQVQRRIEQIEAQLKTVSEGEEARQLRTTLNELHDSLSRARRLAIRRHMLEAALLSLPDKVEEVYLLVLTAPYATDLGSRLSASLERLRLAEEVAAELQPLDRHRQAEVTFQPNGARLSALASEARQPLGPRP